MYQKALKVRLKDKKGNKEKKKTSPSPFWPGTCNEGEKKYRFIKRKSNFSLDFPVFRPSVLVGARGEVDLRYKGYVWTPILSSFDNSGR